MFMLFLVFYVIVFDMYVYLRSGPGRLAQDTSRATLARGRLMVKAVSKPSICVLALMPSFNGKRMIPQPISPSSCPEYPLRKARCIRSRLKGGFVGVKARGSRLAAVVVLPTAGQQQQQQGMDG